MKNTDTVWDVVVVGGGPAGATAAHQLAINGFDVLMIERGGKIKPCGGAVPPRLIRDYQIPDELIVDKALAARMVSPSEKKVDMAIDGGYVGMVDREHFDEWLRQRAVKAGAQRRTAKFKQYTAHPAGHAVVQCETEAGAIEFKARCVVGADGANSRVAQQAVRGSQRGKFVFAYHEIVKISEAASQRFVHANGSVGARCDVIYDSRVSPDFYGWVFPHGDTMSIGTGSADKGYSLKAATARLRVLTGLTDLETIRCEGAPIPLKPLPHWDDGKHVVLAGDAAGVVAPASGEGIYYAMYGGELAAKAATAFLRTGDVRSLKQARKQFMKEHRKVFWVLGMMQWFWYSSDKRREHFVEICKDPDVQKLTFDSYMNKKLVRKEPMAHVRIFFKDMAHLLGFAKA
jgi:geranylgeranyl diphosphate/geranylgeranyl-bacteriochlorophyllide a reductase